MELTLEGDANDYFAKGIHGGRIAVFPPKDASFPAEDNIIVGNTCLYGATGGEVFVRGRAGERYAVRNSGAKTVIEGVGDHGCEYMTGGVAVVLGSTGRNFAAGMSGGIAYVLDEDGKFPVRCNQTMVDLERVEDDEDITILRRLIERHLACTGSAAARRVLDRWDEMLTRFVKVFPKDFRQALTQMDEEERRAAEAKLMPVPA